MDLSIIIRSERQHNSASNGNQAEALISVLQVEIQAIRDSATVEIILIDSCTQEDDLRVVTQQFPSVRIVPSRVELNLPQSYNLGANMARSRSLLFLSADTIFAHGSLLKCLDMVLDTPKASLFCGMLVDQHGAVHPRSQHAINKNEQLANKGLLEDKAVIEWAQGVPMLVSKMVFLEVGGFDEQLSDALAQRNLCQKIKNLGRQVVYWEEIKAIDINSAHGLKPI